jgi:ketosteroid isomerase-like protein
MPTNGEIIRASYTAFAGGDVDGALSAFAPDIEWTHPGGVNDCGPARTRKGHDEVREFMTRTRAVFSSLRPELREFVESGDRVVVFGVHHVEGAHSGVAGSVPFVHSWRLADGKATHFDGRHDTSDVRRIVEPAPAATDPRVDILQLGCGFWASKALLTAVELGVFTELAAKPRDAEALRSALGLHGRGLRDFLDALVSLRLLERDADVYRTTPATGQLLDRAKPDDYIGGTLELATRRFYPCWENLGEALRTGLPRGKATDSDGDVFDTLYADPERMRGFLRAMSGMSAAGNAALVDTFPWQQHRTVVDIGCAEGTMVGQLLRRHQHLTGIGFDLPQVGPVFEETAARFDLADRLSFAPGSFFTDRRAPGRATRPAAVGRGRLGDQHRVEVRRGGHPAARALHRDQGRVGRADQVAGQGVRRERAAVQRAGVGRDRDRGAARPARAAARHAARPVPRQDRARQAGHAGRGRRRRAVAGQ